MNKIKNKVLKTVIIIYIVSIVLGILTYLLSTLNIDNTILNYINSFKDNLNYISGLKRTIIHNLNYSFLIWISGILIIGLITSPITLFLRGLSLGITICSIIANFKLKGVIIALIMTISNIMLYEIIFILLSYYSINLSIKTIKTIKENKQINIKNYYKNYIIRYLILIIILILASFIDIYIVSTILKYIII